MSIYDDLPVDVEANDPGHPGIHNATNTAVKALDGRVTAVESSSADTDDALAAEVTARAAADTTLAAAIALKQDAATAATDTELAAEAATRAAADDALDARLDTLEGSVASGDTVARASIADHIADTVDAHDASAISVAPTGGIAATDVQAALAELDSEKQPADSDLTTFAAIAPSNDDLVQRKAGAWTNRTPAQVKTDLALVKGDVGLGNVDNTSDANKPVSTATQTALDLKAPLASPALTGTPTVPTAAVDTSTTQAASTAFVVGQAASATPVVDGTGAAGSSTRYARADHVHPTDTSRAALASPTFTGTPAAPTAAQGTNTTQLATTAYVQTEAGLLVPKSLVDAKGDLLVGTADNTVARLAVGSNGHVLTADSGQAGGVKWAAAGASTPVVSGKRTTLWYSPPTRSGDLSAAAPAVGTMHAIPIAMPACTLQAIAVRVTTAVGSSLIRLGLYSDDGSGYPGALLLDAGQVSGAATGTVAATISQAFTGGLLWLVAVNQTGTPTCQSTSATSSTVIGLGATTSLAALAVASAVNGYTMTGVTAALPANFSSTVAPADIVLRVAVQVA